MEQRLWATTFPNQRITSLLGENPQRAMPPSKFKTRLSSTDCSTFLSTSSCERSWKLSGERLSRRPMGGSRVSQTSLEPNHYIMRLWANSTDEYVFYQDDAFDNLEKMPS